MTVVLLVQAAVPPATPLRLRAPIAIGTVLAAVCISGVLHRFVETPLQSLLRSRSPASPPIPAT
jgi:peptidoglycan/LPS O-acetylase OafA/YrhL